MPKTKRFLLAGILYLLVYTNVGQAQNSSRVKENAAVSVTEEIDILNAEAQDAVYAKPDTAIVLSRKALEKATRANYQSGEAEALLILATGFSILDNYDTSHHYLQLAKQEFTELQDKQKLAKCISREGINAQSTGDFEMAFKLFQQSVHILEKEGYLLDLSNVFENIGNNFMYQGLQKQALYYHEKSLSIRREKNAPDTLDNFMNMAIVLNDQGKYPEALELYLKVLAVYEARKDDYQISQVHANLGILYRMRHEYDKAFNSYSIALEFQESHGLRLKANKTHNNLGGLLFEQGKHQEAMLHFKEALRIIQEIGTEQDLWMPLLNVGYYYYEADSISKALEFLEKGYASSVKVGSQNGKSVCATMLGLTYSKLNQANKALEYGREGLYEARLLGDRPLLEYALFSLHTIYDEQRSPRKALEVYNEYVAVKDSTLNEKNLQKISELETLYELESKEREIVDLNHEKAQLKLEKSISKQRTALLIVGFLLMIVMSLLLALWQRQRIKDKQKRIEQKDNKLQELARRLANRNQVLQELKDELELEKTKAESTTSEKFMALFRLIENSSKSEYEWEEFVEKFSSIHPNFFTSLQQQFPELSNTEIRLAVLLKLRLTSKEIANIINVSHESVKKGRYRLKKKLGLPQEQDLAKFLYEF